MFATPALFLFWSPILASTCSDDARLCTPVQLCEEVTEELGGKLYWERDESTEHMKLARQYNINCNALPALSDCELDPSNCSIIELCDVATAGDGAEKNWNDVFPKHIALSQSYGLDCSVKPNNTETVSLNGDCNENPSSCESVELCNKAAFITNDKYYLRVLQAGRHVEEVEKRRLDCEQIIRDGKTAENKQKPLAAEELQEEPLDNDKDPVSSSKEETSCDGNPSACETLALCKKASFVSDQELYFRVLQAPDYVTEVENRKVNCMQILLGSETQQDSSNKLDAEEDKPNNSEQSGQFSKSEFALLSFSERKKLQFGLKQLGYYSGVIDGLYGPQTEKAVRDFASTAKISTGYPQSLIIALEEQVDLSAHVNKSKVSPHFLRIKHEDYNVFPFYEIICRSVFQADWLDFKDIEKIRKYLSDDDIECTDKNYKDGRYSLGDMPQAGVRLDLDGDGIRDLLVFLYGFQRNHPLRVVAFKFKNEDALGNANAIRQTSPIARLFEADEIFADGEYPVVQNARFITVADFNGDGKLDIAYADGGFDDKPYKAFHGKVFLSSTKGFIVQNLPGGRLKSHGIASGDIDGDGDIDIVFGKSEKHPQNTKLPLALYTNDGNANFSMARNRLPNSLRTIPKPHLPILVELIDVDGDGHLDLISGTACAKPSKIFWNDGTGFFTDKGAIEIPLDYNSRSRVRGDDCPRKSQYPFATLDQVFLVNEGTTGKRYFGAVASKRWSGAKLFLFSVNGRTLSESVLKNQSDLKLIKYEDQYAYKLTYKEALDGHELDIYDFQFRRTTLRFDPKKETYQYIPSPKNTRNLKLKFDYESIVKN